MKTNVGTIDSIIRLCISIVFTALYLMGVLNLIITIVFFIIGIGLLFTSISGFSPVYKWLGISTFKRNTRA